MTITALRVALPVAAEDRGYDILIGGGLLARAGAEIETRLGARPCLVITDNNVAGPYIAPLEESLRAAGHRCLPSIIIPAGEESKNFSEFAAMAEEALARKPDRKTLIVALGGGVVGDLAGFLAAVLLRGVDFVQIPTTLLAQVDSAVGGKTGIDSAHGKNLIGAFHQPRLVLADIDTLKTLPPRQLRAGFAEVVKYGVIDRPDFFSWCGEYGPRLVEGDAALLQAAVMESCAAKAEIVAADERESGRRALLNLGHTFGHALEALAGFGGRLYHGEAVATGVALALRFSAEEGLCPPEDAARYEALCENCGLPTKPLASQGDIPALMDFMMGDKKNQDGAITLVLARGIGKAFVAPGIETAKIEAFWRKVTKEKLAS
ncbi:MAG: 3-dehydroquinate synthase [Alphaproteobacteria bacterium]